MIVRLLSLILVGSTFAVVLSGCGAEDSAPKPEAGKVLTDDEFEKSISQAPPEAQKRAREEREKAKGLENIGNRDK